MALHFVTRAALRLSLAAAVGSGLLAPSVSSASGQAADDAALDKDFVQGKKGIGRVEGRSVNAHLLKAEFKESKRLLDEARKLLKQGRRDDAIVKASEAILGLMVPVVADGAQGGALSLEEMRASGPIVPPATSRQYEVPIDGAGRVTLFTIRMGSGDRVPADVHRYRYVIALAALEATGPIAVPVLLDILTSRSWTTNPLPRGSLIRGGIAMTLGEIGDKRAIEPLSTLAVDPMIPEELRSSARYALRRITDSLRTRNH